MGKILIFGHKNPDTDSVCGAISLSYFKNQQGFNTEPRILGPINAESEYALKRFNIKVPEYLNDVKVQIKDVNYNKKYLINENKTILEAFNMMNVNGITGLPLVDDDKKFKGYVSLKEIAVDMIYNEDLHVETEFDNLVNILESKNFLKYDEYIDGYAHAATIDDNTFINDYRLDEKTILIVGDRPQLIKHAINRHVKLIILVKDRKLTPELRKLAKENKINVISTTKSSFKISRVLCLSNPIKTIKRNKESATFDANDYLTDFIEIATKLKHTNYPIVNNKNVCSGMMRIRDTIKVNKKKVFLVDHNMLGQSVDGLNEAEIVGIIDHHNIGDINTDMPINFRNMSVGSVNTIIYSLYKENNIKVPTNIAGIMLSGIISDTLLLQSPTTTQIDRDYANELAKLAHVNLNDYGLKLLGSGVSIEGLTANEIVFKDFKTYKVDEDNLAIGQVFTTDIKNYEPRYEEIISELNKVADNFKYKICVLFVTNFLTNNSYILYSNNSKKYIEYAFDMDDVKQGEKIKGIVSRKKQMVPQLMGVVERN